MTEVTCLHLARLYFQWLVRPMPAGRIAPENPLVETWRFSTRAPTGYSCTPKGPRLDPPIETKRWWVRYESICSLARHKLLETCFRERALCSSSSICHRCLRHETSGRHSSVASIAGSPGLWSQHRSRQDHLLNTALPSFPKEAPESAVCEASVYWTLGRGG
jgi:hypothetical protein